MYYGFDKLLKRLDFGKENMAFVGEVFKGEEAECCIIIINK